jgi:nucleotide-binding universal stress UspA family protein
MYHVLLAVAESTERARRQGRFVADLPDATGSVRATVVHAFDDDEESEAPAAMRTPSRVESVRAAVETLEDAGVEVGVEEAAAPAADGLLTLARDLNVDQVVVGGRQRNPVGKAVFGSTAQRVLLESPVPVTLVRDE